MNDFSVPLTDTSLVRKEETFGRMEFSFSILLCPEFRSAGKG